MKRTVVTFLFAGAVSIAGLAVAQSARATDPFRPRSDPSIAGERTSVRPSLQAGPNRPPPRSRTLPPLRVPVGP